MADKLIKKRSSMKAKLTNFSNYLDVVKSCASLSDLQSIELDTRFDKFNALYTEFDDLQTELEALADKPEEAYAVRAQFEEQYFSLVAVARSLLANKNGGRRDSAGFVTGSQASMSGGIKNNFIQLPKISLPNFDGSYQFWLEYRDTYTSLIHENTCIDDISKFHYLRASLKGTAAEMIKNIDFKSDNYSLAWDLLCKRYNNSRLLINNHVQALFNAEPVLRECSTSLRRLIDETNKNIPALKTLNEPTEHWDTLIIYMMVMKLDTRTSRKWEEYRNSLSTAPTLSQFSIFVNNTAGLLETLEGNKKYNKSNNTNNNKPDLNKSKSFVITSQSSTDKVDNNNSFKSNIKCPMCSGNHFLYICETFKKLAVESRIEKAKELKVCMNCLRLGHVEKRCKFSHCKYCSGKHNTLLHSEPIETRTIQDSLPSTSENVAFSDTSLTLRPTTRSYVLLSTALVKVIDSKGDRCDARILLDNGSTANFITENLCDKLRLPRNGMSSTITGHRQQHQHLRAIPKSRAHKATLLEEI